MSESVTWEVPSPTLGKLHFMAPMWRIFVSIVTARRKSAVREDIVTWVDRAPCE